MNELISISFQNKNKQKLTPAFPGIPHSQNIRSAAPFGNCFGLAKKPFCYNK